MNIKHSILRGNSRGINYDDSEKGVNLRGIPT